MEKEFKILENSESESESENIDQTELIEDLNKTIDFLEGELSYIKTKNKDYVTILKEHINFYKNSVCVLLAINVFLSYQLLIKN